MKTSTISPSSTFSSPLHPTLHFTRALLKATLRDRRTLITTLFTPIFMLTLFWLLAGNPEDGDSLTCSSSCSLPLSGLE